MKLYNTALPIAAALAAIISTQPAYAQDSDENFEGVSIGVQGGYERQRIDESVLSGANAVTLDAKKSGLTYGSYVGYDAQFGPLVVGAEAGFSLGGRTVKGDTPNGGSAELNPKWSADASVRAGFVLAERALFYGRVGYNRTRYGVSSFAAGSTTPLASEKVNRDGVLFGAGVEFAATENAALRVEVRRNKLGGTLRSDQVLAGATFRF